MQRVRLAVIGSGVMGQGHLANLKEVRDVELSAVCDIDAEVLSRVSAQYGVPGYDDHRKLLADRACDAVIISTPHYDHPPIAIDCFAGGVHVLSEKPIAVTTKAAKEALAAHRRAAHLRYGIVFNSRTLSVWRKAKEIIESGALGELRRVCWTMTAWFRTQAYYDSGTWRATWAGEGGGLLINQCPHTLDLLTWLAGMPRRVTAHIGIGKRHRIEVEDEINALLEYDNGAIGHFVSSTGEAPGEDRLEIIGDRGTLHVEKGKITIRRAGQSISVFSETTRDLYQMPEFAEEEIAPPFAGFGHVATVQNFVDAVRDGARLVAPAEEGLNSLSLGNAMLLSGLKRRPVEIPFDDEEYAGLIADLAAKSTYRKVVRKPDPENYAGAVH